MNTDLIKGSMASIARWLVAFAVGYFGFEWSEKQIGEASTALAAVLVLAVSIAWSLREKRILLNKTPQPVDTPPVPPSPSSDPTNGAD